MEQGLRNLEGRRRGTCKGRIMGDEDLIVQMKQSWNESLSAIFENEDGEYDENFEGFCEQLMDELVKNGLEDFVLLRNDKLRNWWGRVLKRREKIAKRKEDDRKREELLSRLSDEDKRLLGITPKIDGKWYWRETVYVRQKMIKTQIADNEILISYINVYGTIFDVLGDENDSISD